MLILICLPQISWGQIDRKVIKPVDLSRQTLRAIATGKNGLHKLTSVKRADEKVILTLHKNNGFIWQPLSSIILNKGAEINGMIVNGEQVYIYGRFSYNITPQPNIQYNLLEFNKQWIFQKDFNSFDERDIILDAAIFGDSIIIGGKFDSIGGKQMNNIAFYAKGNFNALKDNADSVGCNNLVSQVKVDGNIYVSGNFTKAGNQAAKALASFNLNTWKSFTTSHSAISKFTIFENDIFFRSNNFLNEIRKINITSSAETIAKNNIDSIYRLTKIFSFNNQLMIIGDFKTVTGIRTGWLSYNNIFWSSVNAAKSCFYATSNSEELFVYGNNLLGYLSQVKSNYIGSFLPVRKLIFGNLYFDFNNSCKIDSGDYPIANTAIKFGTDRFAAYTNKNGTFYYYFSKAENKSPQVILDNSYFNYELCTPDSNSFKNPTNNLIGPTEILLQPELIQKAKLETRAIVHNGSKLKKNGRALVTYLIRNVGFKEASNVTVQLGGKSKLDKFLSIPVATEKDTFYQWNFGAIKPFEIKAITISFALESSLDVLNSIVDFKIDHEYFNSIEVDAGTDFFDQQITDQDFVVAKEQSLMHNAPLHNNAIAATDTVIEYQINFQNRTSDIIQDLIVIDTVDLTYNLLYTKTISSSHDFIETIEQDPNNPDIGYIIYNFQDINLAPNSDANPEITNDQGYVRLAFVFSKKHAMDDQIKNTALVIMDNDIEYSTNTVIATVDRTSSNPKIEVLNETNLFPNPFANSIYFNASLGYNLEYKIFNIQGVEVANGLSNGQEISLTNQANGIYLIHLYTEQGIWAGKCLKK